MPRDRTGVPFDPMASSLNVKPTTILARGTVSGLTLSPDGKTLAVVGSQGIWLYNLDALGVASCLLTEIPAEHVRYVPPYTFAATHIDPQIWNEEPHGGGGGGEAPATGFGADLLSPPTGYISGLMERSIVYGYGGGISRRGKASVPLQEAQWPSAGREISRCGRGLVEESASHTQRRDVPNGLCLDAPCGAFSPDGTVVAGIDNQDNAVLWNLATGAHAVLARNVGVVALSPDNHYLAMSSLYPASIKPARI